MRVPVSSFRKSERRPCGKSLQQAQESEPRFVVQPKAVRLVAPPSFTVGRVSPCRGALARYRQWLALRAQWMLVLRRGDRRLLADAGVAEPSSLWCGERRGLRQAHWML